MKGGDCTLVGKIYTLDDSRPIVEGVTICDGRITYIGEAREARRRAGPNTVMIDFFGDYIALPGFIGSQSYPIALGRHLGEVDCRSCLSFEKITEVLQTRTNHTSPGQWVLGNGYDDTLLNLAFEEDQKRTLKEGEFGDVVILEGDPYQVAPKDTKDIPVAMIIVRGEVTYTAE